MALLQSVSTRTKFSGFLRSSHALLGLLAVLCLAFSMASSNPIVTLGSFFLFVGIASVVTIRYLWKGPEQDRLQPSMVFTEASAHLTNIGPAEVENLPFFREFVRLAAEHRQALPLPSGKVVDGEVVMLTEDQAREIAREDQRALKPVSPSQPGSSEEPAEELGR
jgi:hypothetical protein